MSNHTPSSDSELKTMVRAITNYGTTQIPDGDLDTLIDVAKMELPSSITNYYADDGIAKALVFATCIYAKSRLENQPLQSWNVGDEVLEARNASPEDSQQYTRWNDNLNDGLSESDTYGGASFSLTSNYNF